MTESKRSAPWRWGEGKVGWVGESFSTTWLFISPIGSKEWEVFPSYGEESHVLTFVYKHDLLNEVIVRVRHPGGA